VSRPPFIDASAKLRWIGPHGLGVRCDRCLHQAILQPSDFGPGHGMMRRLADLRFRCSRCGSRRAELHLLHRPGDVKRFRLRQ
jgi:DNA-directed RNA polymerase subunit RPC12/RpoP